MDFIRHVNFSANYVMNAEILVIFFFSQGTFVTLQRWLNTEADTFNSLYPMIFWLSFIISQLVPLQIITPVEGGASQHWAFKSPLYHLLYGFAKLRTVNMHVLEMFVSGSLTFEVAGSPDSPIIFIFLFVFTLLFFSWNVNQEQVSVL